LAQQRTPQVLTSFLGEDMGARDPRPETPEMQALKG
jgi:hypothetical protein